jgi:hypothetical protein
MRNDASPCQTKPGKELTLPSISICLKWIPHEFDIVAMLANSGLCHPVLALAKLCRKMTSDEKRLKRLKRIINNPVPNGATLVCISRTWMAQSPPVSCRRKEFTNVCSEDQCGRVFRRDDDIINEYSKLLQQGCEKPMEPRPFPQNKKSKNVGSNEQR